MKKKIRVVTYPDENRKKSVKATVEFLFGEVPQEISMNGDRVRKEIHE